MQIELFMPNFSYDRVEVTPVAAAGGWLHGGMEKPRTMSSVAAALGAKSGGGLVPRLFLREEEWGGLVFHKGSRAIFEVDKEAFVLLTQLAKTQSIEEFKELSAISEEEFTGFSSIAKKYDLLG